MRLAASLTSIRISIYLHAHLMDLARAGWDILLFILFFKKINMLLPYDEAMKASDGSSTMCPECGELVERERWHAHVLHWCPSLHTHAPTHSSERAEVVQQGAMFEGQNTWGYLEEMTSPAQAFSSDFIKIIPSSTPAVGTPQNSRIPVGHSDHRGQSFEDSQYDKLLQILQADTMLHLHANESIFRETFKQMNARLASSKDQRQACEAVMHFASKNDVNKLMVAETGGIEAIIDAMRKHTQVSDVQLAACRAIHQLAKCHTLHYKLTTAGGLECLIASLKNHDDNHEIQVA
jgi:hypothetical protein